MKAHGSARFSSRCYRFRYFDVGSHPSINSARPERCLTGSAFVRWLHGSISPWAEFQFVRRYDGATELRIAGKRGLRVKELLALPPMEPLSRFGLLRHGLAVSEVSARRQFLCSRRCRRTFAPTGPRP